MFWLKALLKKAELDGMVQNSCNLQSVICGGLMPSTKNLPDGKLVEHPKTHAPSAYSLSALHISHACHDEQIFSDHQREHSGVL